MMIVPKPWPSPITAFTGDDRFTVKVSFGSNLLSPLTETEIVSLDWFAANVSVPLVDE